MIDFNNASFIKLKPLDDPKAGDRVRDLLVDDEQIFASFKAIRDMVFFTNRRIIAVNVQGITGKKVDYTSLPYSKIQAFSFESAGLFDIDAEMELWFSGLGKVKFDFVTSFDVRTFSKFIANYVL